MKHIFLLTTSLLAFTTTLCANIKPKETAHPIAFTENKGQVHDQHHQPRADVLFGASSGELSLHIRKSGLSYQLCRVDETKEVEDPTKGHARTEITQQTLYRVDLQWLNCASKFATQPDEALPGYNNYYTASCPNGALNVKSYTGVTLKGLYPGIDLHYYEKQGELKHDYLVAPHADYTKIRIRVEGAQVRPAADGSLLFETPLGTVQEGKPLVFQNGRQLKARWRVEENVLSFDIVGYNANQALVIDPVTRIWGTYYGGASVSNGTDYGEGTATDASNNVYLCGHSIASGTIMATSGTHQTVLAGSDDAFLAKFNSNGTRIWGTFFGGTDTETGVSCAPDASGNVYLTGLTRSTSGISTPGTFQTSHSSSSNYDGYLVKFNSNGMRLWGSYFGGSAHDFPSACALSSDGIYVAGTSEYASGGVFTAGVHQPSPGGGVFDGFLVKFNPATGTQYWGTYYGGPGDDRGFSCATDPQGNVYLSGYTTATVSNVIATAGSHQSSIAGTGSAYLVKFAPSGARFWGTYYGNGGEFGLDCITDASGNVYLAGNTYTAVSGSTVIATPGTHQTAPAGAQDAFVVKMNSSGVRQWGTYYGGSNTEYCYSCAVDGAGNVYLGGTTTSTNSSAISTPGSHQLAFAGGTVDIFVAKLDPNGLRLDGSYFGGSGYEYGGFLALSSTAHVYVAGHTGSSTGTAIATPGTQQPIFGGTPYDAFLAKFDMCQAAPALPAISGATTACIGLAYTYSTPLVQGVHSYTWVAPSGWTSSGGTYSITATAGATGVFSLSAENACGVSTQTLSVSVYPNPTVTVNSGTLCSGKPFTLSPSGAVTYSYSGGQVVSPQVTSTYTVTGTSADGCSSNAVSTIAVVVSPVLTVTSAAICLGQSFTMSPAGASSYSYSEGPVVTPSVTSSYTVTGVGQAACTSTAVVNITVNPLPNFTPQSSGAIICIGESATLSAAGIVSISTNPPGQGAVVSPTVTTTYTVTGTDAKGCSNTAMLTQNVDLCTGLRENANEELGLRFYPNPVKEVLNVDAETACDLTIYNSLGQVVKRLSLQRGTQAILLTDLAAGLYVLKAIQGNDVHTLRMLKE